MMNHRDYSVNLNVNFNKPLSIEIRVVLENNVQQAQLAQELRKSSDELKEAVENNQPETP